MQKLFGRYKTGRSEKNKLQQPYPIVLFLMTVLKSEISSQTRLRIIFYIAALNS